MIENKPTRSQRPRWMGVLATLAGSALLTLSVGALADSLSLAAGDEVQIDVVGQSELSTEGVVSQSGRITMPLLGEVDIGGLSSAQAAARIARQLQDRGFVRSATVNLSVQNEGLSGADFITVLGEVNRSGRFPLGSANRAGVSTFTDALAEAGGATDTAADYAFVQTRGNSEPIRIDMQALLQRGDLSGNVALPAGSTIVIPRMDVFYIYGEVQRPGRYRLEPGMTVEQALSISSGLTARGTAKGIATSRKDDNGKVKKYRIELDDQLQPGDVLFVREGLF
ncbi:MAG: polysaccharide biosynthesis/export family protein [Pseudomonadota bacterium]